MKKFILKKNNRKHLINTFCLISAIFVYSLPVKSEEELKRFGVEAGFGSEFFITSQAQVRASYRLPVLDNRLDLTLAYNLESPPFILSTNKFILSAKYYPLNKEGLFQPFLNAGSGVTIHSTSGITNTISQPLIFGIGNDFMFKDNMGIVLEIYGSTSFSRLDFILPSWRTSFKYAF